MNVATLLPRLPAPFVLLVNLLGEFLARFSLKTGQFLRAQVRVKGEQVLPAVQTVHERPGIPAVAEPQKRRVGPAPALVALHPRDHARRGEHQKKNLPLEKKPHGVL